MKSMLLAMLMSVSIGGSMLAMAAPQVAGAAKATACSSDFLGFPAWYRGLIDESKADCRIKSPNDTGVGGLSGFIWRIGLNVVEVGVLVVGYLSGVYFLYGGYLFIISRGNPEGAVNARKTMINAMIGLIIAMASIGIINFIIDGVLK